MAVFSEASCSPSRKSKTREAGTSSHSSQASRMETGSGSWSRNQYGRLGIDEESASEHAPLLQTRSLDEGQQNGQSFLEQQNKEKRQRHNRTVSVDASGVFASTNKNNNVDLTLSPNTLKRKAAPGRHHHRTRSLEEWANLFGIEGIHETNDPQGQPRERELYQKKTFLKPPSPPKSGFVRGPKPPLPPKPAALKHRVSSSSPATKNFRKTLDIITEAENIDESESGGSGNEVPKDRSGGDNGRASFAAAATADVRSSENSMNFAQSTTETLSPSPQHLHAASSSSYAADNDSNSVASSYDGNSTLSVPQHLNDSGRFSFDDSSINSDTTEHTHHAKHYRRSSSQERLLMSQRLSRFEQEQEVRFQLRKRNMEKELSNVLERDSSKSQREQQEFINAYMMELEKEKARLVKQWREEWEREEEFLRQQDPKIKLFRDLRNAVGKFLDSVMNFFSAAEVFISNMPLTIAALGLSWVSMGCCWYKYMEENVDSCNHVHFYSPQCTFPEFPGCFECDLENPWYILGVNFHYFCSSVSFVFCSMIMLKVIIAWDVVMDELSNPTTSTPCGVFCIAMVCVFAGRGPLGETVVLITAIFHVILAFWFLYMAIYRFRLYPEPGWFPNTVGISYAAVKSFLYFPVLGRILMTFCLTFFLGVFFVSVIRVATNPKIAAPICWFMLSAPSITLYAVTLISQPIADDEHAMAEDPELKAKFVGFLHQYYLPLHHFLAACSIVGVVSAVHGVSTRWEKFKEKSFSPAHVAFCSPTLAHANAIQSYRATIDALSGFPPGGWFRTAIYIYWCLVLFAGTIVNLIFTYKFVSRLPEWTKVDVADEEAPPAPYETMTHEMLDDRGVHETMFHQAFVSPAVLEANEAGALVRVRRGTEDYRRFGPYVRTRKTTARGFDPSMNDTELREERAAMLDWVAKNAPRKRNRTMSIPGVMHLVDKSGRGVYGTFMDGLGYSSESGDSSAGASGKKHSRSKTGFY